MHAVNFTQLPGYLSDRPVVAVYFSSPTCGPCRNMPPLLAQLEKSTGVPLVKVDINDSSQLTQRYGLTSVPTVGFFEYGQEVQRVVGVPPTAARLISAARKYL